MRASTNIKVGIVTATVVVIIATLLNGCAANKYNEAYNTTIFTGEDNYPE